MTYHSNTDGTACARLTAMRSDLVLEFDMQSGIFLKFMTVAAVASLALTSPYSVSSSEAGASKYKKAKSSKGSTQVRGYSRKVGGYSYSYADSIIDFRDRSVFLDPTMDQQSGPFDSGFFFESGVERHNDSPYLY